MLSTALVIHPMGAKLLLHQVTSPSKYGTPRLALSLASLWWGILGVCGLLLTLLMGSISSQDLGTTPFESGMLITGVVVGKPLEGHTDVVLSVAYSSDGRHIISGSRDSTIRIWDAKTGTAVGQSLKGHTMGVKTVTYSPNGRHIVSGSKDCTIRIWDAKTGTPAGNSLDGHTGSVNSVAYSPSGDNIISGSADMTIRIWEIKTGVAVSMPIMGHAGSIIKVGSGSG